MFKTTFNFTERPSERPSALRLSAAEAVSAPVARSPCPARPRSELCLFCRACSCSRSRELPNVLPLVSPAGGRLGQRHVEDARAGMWAVQ